MAGEGTMSVDVGRNGGFTAERRAKKDKGNPERLERSVGRGRSRPVTPPPANPPKGSKDK